MKQGLSKVIDKFNAFAKSDWYIALVAAVVYAGWVSGYWAAFLCVLAVICALPLFTSDSNRPILAFFFHVTFIIGHEHHDLGAYWWLLFFLIPLLGGVVFQTIRFRRGYDWGILSPKRIKGQNCLLLLMAVPFALGGVTRSHEKPVVVLIAFLLFLLIGVFYSFLMAGTYRREDKKTLPDYVLKCLISLGVVISLQLLTFYIRLGSMDDILYCIKWKFHELGWGGPNNIGLMYTLTIPAAFYYCTRQSKLTPLFVLLGVLELGLLVSTGSRGAIFVVLFALPAILLYVMAVTPNKLAYGISLCAVLLVGVGLLVWKADKIIPAMADRFALGFSANGRFENEYPKALDAIKHYPVFGAGWDYLMGTNFSDGYTPFWFHSTALQVASMMGVFGFLVYAVWFFQRYRVFYLQRKDRRILFLFVSTLLFGTYSMVDTGFFSPTFLVMVLIMQFAAEVNLPENKGYALPRKWVQPKPKEPADLD